MIGTLAGLIADGCDIRAWCKACGADEKRIDPLALALRFGENAELEPIRKKLRCDCGAVGQVFWMPRWPGVPMGLGK